MTVTYSDGMRSPIRGRPPKPEGPATPAQRKRAQRARDRLALWAAGDSMDELTTSALVEQISALIRDERPGTLGAVLVELGRRGGVSVTARPSAAGGGRRVKS